MNKIFCLILIFFTLGYTDHLQENDKTKIEKKEKSFSYYVKLAKKRDPEALFKLGKFYYEGKIVKRSYKKALKYLNRSSALGYEKATYNLGILYANNKTIYHSYSKSYEIFLELAKEGHAPSQNKVGTFLTFGFGGPIDFVEAVKWFEKSSKQSYITAQCNLASMYAAGMGVFTNFGRAHAFAKKGKELRHPICLKIWREYNLGKYKKDKGFKFKFYTQP